MTRHTLIRMLVRDSVEQPKTSTTGPSLLEFLAFLVYLRSVRPSEPHLTKVLLTLILVVGMVLVVLALVVIGKPEYVSEALQHLPVVP